MKYLLLSVIVAALALPIAFGFDPWPRRGLRRALLAVAIFNTLYLVALWLTHGAPAPSAIAREPGQELGAPPDGKP